MIKLEELSLNEIRKSGSPSGGDKEGYDTHPLLKEGNYYLAKIDGKWYSGTFTKRWLGWYLNVYHGTGGAGGNTSHIGPSFGYQFSKVGWEQLYIIIDKDNKDTGSKQTKG